MRPPPLGEWLLPSDGRGRGGTAGDCCPPPDPWPLLASLLSAFLLLLAAAHSVLVSHSLCFCPAEPKYLRRGGGGLGLESSDSHQPEGAGLGGGVGWS